jgi:hypothetical protein
LQHNIVSGGKVMGKSKFLALVLATGLASCGAPLDNPTNIPLRGKWSDEGKLMSMTVGGAAVDTKSIPGLEALKDKVSEKRDFCGEPSFLSKEQFQSEIDKNNPAGCQIDTVTASEGRAEANGSCNGLNIPGVQGSATFKGISRMKPDKVVYDMSFKIIVREKATGAGEVVVMEAQRTMKRLGDC